MPAQAVERKLVAILAADIAGFSRLVGADEEGALSRLKSLRRDLIDPSIAEHRGRIVKTTGDGILIEFASVVDAVRCAVAVQRATAAREASLPQEQRIAFRVGVNLGDIVVEGDDILGDGVNIAARLEGIAEPGGICISGVVHDQVRGKIEVEFADLGGQSLRNISRPVRAYRVVLDQSTSIAPAAPPLPDKPSVAVRPFANMSSDPEQEFFADGITDDIITALSRYPSLFVIARNSCFTYKGRAVEVRQVGRELGVRYMLEGSLRKSGNRIRVSAQLFEAESGNHVWAERYDRDLADIFAVQDEIAEAVTIAIAPAVAAAEQRRAMRKPPENLDAWGAYQRGLWHLGKLNAEDNALAQRFFQTAIDLDPTFAGGYKGLCIARPQGAAEFGTHSLSAIQSSVEELARRAVAFDNADAEAHSILSNLLRLRGDYAGALVEAECALAITPNLALGHAAKGAVLIFSGLPREGLAALELSMRLDPRGPSLATLLNQRALGFYFCRDYDAAIEAAKATIRFHPEHPLVYRWLAAALGQVGQLEEAKKALAKAMAVVPGSFDRYVRSRVPWMRSEDHAHMLEGLRKAGWEG